jgi:hypothetical protein
MKNEIIEEIILNVNGDNTGKLVSIESKKNIPFNIERIFYIYGTSGDSIRGKHANKNSQFVMVCLNGSVKVMVDDGKNKEEVLLNNPFSAIFIPKMTWKEMYDFSTDCILLVISDCVYDSEEYIKNYDLFLEVVSNEKK